MPKYMYIKVLSGSMTILYNVNSADQEHSVNVGVGGPENFFFNYQHIKQR